MVAKVGDLIEAAVDPLEMARLECSDLGNAQRLIARFADSLMYVPELGWLVWNGRHYELNEALARRAAHRVAAGLADEIEAMRAEAERLKRAGHEPRAKAAMERAVKLLSWREQTGNAGHTSAMLSQAAAYVSTEVEALDPHGDCLVCQPGGAAEVLRLKRAAGDVLDIERLAYQPGLRQTRSLACRYDPAAQAPGWLAHLARVLPDEGARGHFQRWMGYCLFAGNGEQRILILQGRGGDGKSTSMGVIRRILGGYAAAPNVMTFLEGPQRSAADASPDLAKLGGDVRLASAGEPNKRSALNEALIKSITGGAPVSARHLNKGLFEYVPRFKIVIECNPLPRISGDDDGIWRRIDLIHFPVRIPEREIDRGLEDRLVATEAEGIFNWLLEGAQLWVLDGLQRPIAVQEAVDAYRADSSPFSVWARERLDTDDPAAATAGSILYQDYQDWCRVEEKEALSQNAFGRALSARQLMNIKDRRGNKVRKGVRLHPRPSDWAAVPATDK